MLHSYLLIGVGVYLGCAFNNFRTFKTASFLQIVVGLIVGIGAWPVALVITVLARLGLVG